MEVMINAGFKPPRGLLRPAISATAPMAIANRPMPSAENIDCKAIYQMGVLLLEEMNSAAGSANTKAQATTQPSRLRKGIKVM